MKLYYAIIAIVALLVACDGNKRAEPTVYEYKLNTQIESSNTKKSSNSDTPKPNYIHKERYRIPMQSGDYREVDVEVHDTYILVGGEKMEFKYPEGMLSVYGGGLNDMYRYRLNCEDYSLEIWLFDPNSSEYMGGEWHECPKD